MHMPSPTVFIPCVYSLVSFIEFKILTSELNMSIYWVIVPWAVSWSLVSSCCLFDNSPFFFSILFYVNFWNAIYTHHQILPLYIVNMLTCGLFHTMSAGACLLKYNDLDCGGNSGSVKSLLALRHSAFNFLYLCPLYAIDVPNTIL